MHVYLSVRTLLEFASIICNNDGLFNDLIDQLELGINEGKQKVSQMMMNHL